MDDFFFHPITWYQVVEVVVFAALLVLLTIIVITGYPDLINEKDVKAYGADYFFLKPLELDKLREAVRKCLHLNDISNHRDL